MSVLAFSQVENATNGLRISQNENEVARGSNADTNTNTRLLLNNEQTKSLGTFAKDANYANRKSTNELSGQKVQNSNTENSPQLKSGTRSTAIYEQDFTSVNTGSMTTSSSQQDG